MDWEEDGENPLGGAGYDERKVVDGVVAHDADDERIVYATTEELVVVSRDDGGIETNGVSLPVDEPIDDVATGQPSEVYVVVDGEIRVLSANGSLSDTWEDHVAEVAVPTEAKVIGFVDGSGAIHGLDTQNRLPKFQAIEFTDSSGTQVTPTLVAGRAGFIAYGGDTARSYDQRGTVRWTTHFEAEVVDIGQLQGGCVVGLANDSIHWINAAGESTTVIGGSLEAIATVGHRLLIGSSNDAVRAFGDNGLAPTVAELRVSAVTQTSDDTLLALVIDGALRLFTRQNPGADVHASTSPTAEGVRVDVEVENPYPIPLQLQLDVDDGTVERELFIPPRGSQTEVIDIAGRSVGEAVAVDIASADGTICAFDGTVTVSAASKDDETTAPHTETPVSDDTTATGDGSAPAVANDDDADPRADLSFEEGSDGSTATTEDPLAIETDTTDRSATVALSESASAASRHEDTSVTTPEDVEQATVSVSLEVVNVEHSQITWRVRFTNHTDGPVTDVRIEETTPVKFSLDGPRSAESVESGESFTVRGSFQYRSGLVSAVIRWTDADGDDHERSVQEAAPQEFFEARAERQSLEGDGSGVSERVDFTLINGLDVPVSDTVTINAIQGMGSRTVGRYDITLSPGPNLLTKFLTPEDRVISQNVTSYEVGLRSLGVSDTVTVVSDSQKSPADFTELAFSRSVAVRWETGGQMEYDLIDSVPLESRSTDRLVERLTLVNHSNSWVPANRLWTNESGTWSVTDQHLPSLHRGQAVRLSRHWQCVGDDATLTTRLPQHRLGERGPTISAEEHKTTRPNVAVCAASTPIAPSGEYVLLLFVSNRGRTEIELTSLELENEFGEKPVGPYPISGGSKRVFHFDLNDTFEVESYSGLARTRFNIGTRQVVRDAVVTRREDPPIDDSKLWFRADCDYSIGDEFESVTLTIHNERSEMVEEVAVQPRTAPGAGVFKSELGWSESLGVRVRVDAEAPERHRLAEIYEVSATIDGTERTEYVQIQPVTGNVNPAFTATVLPKVETIDTEEMLDTWPDQVSTDWRYDGYRNDRSNYSTTYDPID